MFSFLKRNPASKLKKQYEAILEQAMQAQRNGDIKTYSLLTADAEEIYKKIQKLEATQDA
jgi:cell fate (sporulation/competence/biofilm development) regulator YlbF (YheA/YmcA/DUF963 family)